MTRLRSPKIAFCDLTNGEEKVLLEQDRAAFGQLFGEAIVADAIVQCDVLFVYCRVEADGLVRTLSRPLANAVSSSWATIAVIASENSGPSYQAAFSSSPAENLVLTLARNGNAFPAFFTALFTAMFEGKSMPSAWARLAPQTSSPPDTLPSTIFVAGAGHVSFARDVESPKSGFFARLFPSSRRS